NAMVDRRPGLILRCTSTEDVVAAVNVAREYGLPPSVRCGGHNVAGKAMSDGGLTIDLSGLREATVDPERKLVHAARGGRLGGGNFGIVTRFTFRAHDFGPMMRIGVSVYEPEQAAAALREYARVVPTLPRTVGWHAALKHDMPALPFVPPEYVGKRLLMLVSM